MDNTLSFSKTLEIPIAAISSQWDNFEMSLGMRLQVDKGRYSIELQPIVDVLDFSCQGQPFGVLRVYFQTVGPRTIYFGMHVNVDEVTSI